MASSTTVVQARKRVRDEEAPRPLAGPGPSPPLILRSRGHPGSLVGVARVAHDVFSSSCDAPRRTGTSQHLGLHACYPRRSRSEEHTSELQSLRHLVCRLLLEKKKKR